MGLAFRTLAASVTVIISACTGLQASLSVYSTGFYLPETISLAPASFGLPAGTLVVADAGNISTGNPGSVIYAIPPGGGVPYSIGSGFGGGGTLGGVFAPASFGALSGNYLAFGFTGSPAGAYALSSAGGTVAPFYSDFTPNSYSIDTPSVAPAGFGATSGEILAPEAFFGGSTSPVLAFSPSGSVSTFATITNFVNAGVIGGFGSVFAPAGFVPGTTSPVLLVSDTFSGAIDWIDSSGNVHLFATVPLGPNQTGLRQLAFAPAGFGAYGGDLFVSVSGSNGGGGTFGSVDVINSQGKLVGVLKQGTVGAPFDPRGLYFTGQDQLLIADADPSIISAPPSAITPTPEPNLRWLATAALGSAWIAAAVRRRKRSLSRE